MTTALQAQTRKVRVGVPDHPIAVLSFLGAKMNGYCASKDLDDRQAL
jgi:hypothetical protein